MYPFTKTKNLLLLTALVLFALAGCSTDRNLAEPQGLSQGDHSRLAYSAEAGAVMPGTSFISATLHVYASQSSAQTVSLHRVTADWAEMDVTWNNFGGSFDAAVVNSFPSNATGWHAIDITALFQGWFDGSIANFGILMDQTDMTFPRTVLNSRQNVANQPYLEICYATSGGTMCEMLMADADAYIYEVYPDANTGMSENLNMGWYHETDLEKQTLIRFMMPEIQELAALGDFVWFDKNCNGIQDADDNGVPGVTVNLYDCQDVLLATMMTDANGYYLFDQLQPGDYYVEFIAPEGYEISPQNQGGDTALDSDADVTTGRTICTTLTAGETDLTWDAGLCMIVQDGCSLTIGYWKTHGGFGPQPDMVTPLLPIWLGNPGGSMSMFVNTGEMAHDILLQNVYGHPDNGITKLMAQMLGAKLNIANGAGGSSVGNAISRADDFLADHDWTEWDSLSRSMQSRILRWHAKFDDYNNGLIGPGHCD